ncbi:MAG: universal stress protein [bacterium]|nr:universal stress protein [bacterium]
MFTKIVIGTDLSEASDCVIGCLHELKSWGASEIILTYALGIRHLDSLKYELARQAEPKLQEQKKLLEDQGYKVAIRIEPDTPAFEINRVARETNASMIVIGAQGATLARDLLLGSVATEVLYQAHHPVLVAKLLIDATKDQVRCKMACSDFRTHVMFATDFSDTAERAFSYLEKIVEGGGHRISLVHVQDRPHIDPYLRNRLDEFNQIDQERMERMQIRLKELGARDIRIAIPYGHPVEEILSYAHNEGATLIVMGTMGRTALASVLLGSVSYRVTRLSKVSMLLVPPVRLGSL